MTKVGKTMENQGKSAIFYLNMKTGEYKGYTSIKSLCIDKPEFKAVTLYNYIYLNKGKVYARGDHRIYKVVLHTYK